MEKEAETRRQAEVSLEKEHTTRLATEIRLKEEMKARSELEETCSKERILGEKAETARKKEKKARAAAELLLFNLRHSEATLKTQLSDAQAWRTAASAYYDGLKANAEATVQRERENCMSAEKLTREAQADTRRLEVLLQMEKAERERLVHMLEIEALGRARIEQLLEARKIEEGALIKMQNTNADLENQVSRLKEQLDNERQSSARLVSLLEHVKTECSAPFVVPAIMDVFTIITGITDEALGGVTRSSLDLDSI